MEEFTKSTVAEEKKLLSCLKQLQLKTILVIENSHLLFPLQRLFPHATIYAVTSDEEKRSTWKELHIKVVVIDYEREILPYEKNFFDLILAPHVFERAELPRDIAYGFKSFLKDEGLLLTSFFNVRSFKVLEALRKGYFPLFHLHAFSKSEIEALFLSVFYEEITLQRVPLALTKEEILPFQKAHFMHLEELQVESYVVIARKEQSELVHIKKNLAQKVRQRLTLLLHRLEYDIDSRENIEKLWQFIEVKNISLDYFVKFILLMTIEKEKLISLLIKSLATRNTPFSKKELQEHLAREALFLEEKYREKSERLAINPISDELLNFLESEK